MSSSIDDLLGPPGAGAPNMHVPMGPMGPPPPSQALVGTLAPQASSKWMATFAGNMFNWIFIFASIFIVSLPVFQDVVLAYIPQAVSPAGTLSSSGAFFKAVIGTGIFILLQIIVRN